MKTSDPLVSILTACYNGEKFISQYEKCLLSQTYRPIECIVVNDGSTDNSAELLEGMAERLSTDGLIVHVIHQRNVGAAQAVSEAFSCSSGELICCWDIDDVFFPDNLSTLIETLRNNPSVDCVVCNGYFAQEGELERHISSFDSVEREPSTNHFFYQLAVGETWNWAGSYVVRASRLIEVYGGRRFPSLQVDRNSQNLPILMPCAIHGCVYVEKPLMKYVQHDSSVTHEKDDYFFKRDFMTVFEEIRLRLLTYLDMSTPHLLSGCKLLSVKLKTEFPASAPAWRKTSPEGRESRHAGRATPGIYGNAAVQWRTTACHDGNLKCSVIRGIVRLPTTKPTIMTEQDKITIFDAIINPFLCHTPSPGAQGSGYLFPEALRRMLNASLSAQCDNHIGCAKHERSVNRNGMRNGYKPRTILTSTGEITLDVPQVRNSATPFHPVIPGFEQGARIDRALNLSIAEMYLQGVSTRKVAKVMKELCGGHGVSAAYVSQCAAQLDELFEQWRTRPLPLISHLFLDATYIKTRLNNRVTDCAVFVAVGIEAETGKRIVLGISTGISEAAEHWSAFIQSLLDRGMNTPLTVTSDDHKGIRTALARTLTGTLWQRCQFHFQQNAQAYVTSARYKGIAASHIRSIFNAGNRNMAKLVTQNVLATFREDGQDKLADWLEENIEECLTIIDCPPNVQRCLRTSNIMECINRQLKRRTNVVSIFPSEASLLRLVTAKAMDLSDEWEGSSKTYITPEKLRQTAEVLTAAAPQSRESNAA